MVCSLCTCYVFNGILVLQQSNTEYSTKLASSKVPEKQMFNLGWKIDELSRLIEDGRKQLVTITRIIELLEDDGCSLVDSNVPQQICSLKKITSYIVEG